MNPTAGGSELSSHTQKEYAPRGAGLVLRNLAFDELPAAYAYAETFIPVGLASPDAVETAFRISSECVWVAEQTMASGERAYKGLFWFFPITAEAEAALLDGQLDFTEPHFDAMCSNMADASALYCWLLIASGRGRVLVPDVHRRLDQPPYGQFDVYARASTPEGIRVLWRTGFRPLDLSQEMEVGMLTIFRRTPATDQS